MIHIRDENSDPNFSMIQNASLERNCFFRRPRTGWYLPSHGACNEETRFGIGLHDFHDTIFTACNLSVRAASSSFSSSSPSLSSGKGGKSSSS